MRDEPKIDRRAIVDCLRLEYDRSAIDMQFLPVGLDVNAGIYRVTTDSDALIVKVKSGTLYKASCLVPRALRDQGIESVVAPLPAENGALWTTADGWNVIVYPCIEGETGREGVTPAQWVSVGRTFRRIHDGGIDASVAPDLRVEAFDPAAYRRTLESLGAELGEDDSDPLVHDMRSLWAEHCSTVEGVAEKMDALAARLRARSVLLVICHADLHPNNLLRDRPDHAFIIDWDDVMLAARERDFIFIPDYDRPEGSPFFDGYGKVEIDWEALAYYRYERVLTDAIAYMEEALNRDLSDETRQESLKRFVINAEGRMLASARLAEIH